MQKFKFVNVLLCVLTTGLILLHFNCSEGSDIANQPADFKLQADELFRDFSENEAAGNTKYVGKILKVVGTIKSVVPTSNGTVNLELVANDGSVVCNFPKKDLPSLSKIKIGSSAKIKGMCSGFLFDVMLDNCVLIK